MAEVATRIELATAWRSARNRFLCKRPAEAWSVNPALPPASCAHWELQTKTSYGGKDETPPEVLAELLHLAQQANATRNALELHALIESVPGCPLERCAYCDGTDGQVTLDLKWQFQTDHPSTELHALTESLFAWDPATASEKYKALIAVAQNGKSVAASADSARVALTISLSATKLCDEDVDLYVAGLRRLFDHVASAPSRVFAVSAFKFVLGFDTLKADSRDTVARAIAECPIAYTNWFFNDAETWTYTAQPHGASSSEQTYMSRFSPRLVHVKRSFQSGEELATFIEAAASSPLLKSLELLDRFRFDPDQHQELMETVGRALFSARARSQLDDLDWTHLALTLDDCNSIARGATVVDQTHDHSSPRHVSLGAPAAVLPRLVGMIGSTVRRLDLFSGSEYMSCDILATVLQTQRELRELNVRSLSTDSCEELASMENVPHSLHTLRLRVASLRDPSTAQTVQAVLRAVGPSLRTLELEEDRPLSYKEEGDTKSWLAPAISEYCPKLTKLFVERPDKAFFTAFTDMYDEGRGSVTTFGLDAPDNEDEMYTVFFKSLQDPARAIGEHLRVLYTTDASSNNVLTSRMNAISKVLQRNAGLVCVTVRRAIGWVEEEDRARWASYHGKPVETVIYYTTSRHQLALLSVLPKSLATAQVPEDVVRLILDLSGRRAIRQFYER